MFGPLIRFNRKNDTFGRWLAVSLLIHILFLLIQFGYVDSDRRLDQDEDPLDVVLVNAETDKENLSPQVLAQVNLLGGGDSQSGRVTSPLTDQGRKLDGEKLKILRKRQAQLEQEQKMLLTQISGWSYHVKSKQKGNSKGAQKYDQEDDPSQLLLRQAAEISDKIHDYNKLPKREMIAASARKVVHAQYYQRIKDKIEKVGTQMFPKDASGLPIYGSLVVSFSIWKDGSLEKIDVERSSGNKALDLAAVSAVKRAAPFDSFSTEMKKRIDALDVTTTFQYANNEGLTLVQKASSAKP